MAKRDYYDVLGVNKNVSPEARSERQAPDAKREHDHRSEGSRDSETHAV